MSRARLGYIADPAFGHSEPQLRLVLPVRVKVVQARAIRPGVNHDDLAYP